MESESDREQGRDLEIDTTCFCMIVVVVTPLEASQEYVLDSEGAMATCMREAALLVKLRHPSIAQVVAVFEDPDPNRRAFFIQMPYYPYGHLESWIGAYAPRATAVRNALKDVLSALVRE